MSIFSKLFGGGKSAPKVEPTLHKDYRIFPEPAQAQGGFQVQARIQKDFDGETKTHMMIRADKCQSMDEASDTALFKAKMLIDQQGDSIFR